MFGVLSVTLAMSLKEAVTNPWMTLITNRTVLVVCTDSYGVQKKKILNKLDKVFLKNICSLFCCYLVFPNIVGFCTTATK